MKGNIVVGQSGGPTAVINSSVAGVYAAAKKLGVKKIYGMVHGIEGFLEDRMIDLGEYLNDETGIELLKRTPSAFLGSCRFKMPKIEGHEDVYEKVFEIMEKHDIECLFYAGGNDSMDTVKMLSDYAAAHNKPQRFMGVPKTIDNDLPVTDHCPGYGSAAKYIATSVKEIIRDNESFGAKKPTVCIVEIMGRNAGWLTAAAALAKGDDCQGCDAIYLPERVFDIDRFVADVKELAANKSSVVIAVSEGVKVADGRYVCEIGREVAVDAFGHKQMSGTAVMLADKIGKERSVAVNASVSDALYILREKEIHREETRYLFPNGRKGSGHLSRSQAFRIIKEAAEYAGLEEHISCHSLRKTFGYHAWKQGVQPALLMELYNHSSYRVTKQYLCIEQDDKDRVYLTVQL